MNNETTASQPKSIGDDAQFDWQWIKATWGKLFAWQVHGADGLSDDINWKAFAAVINNSRAPAAQASATIQAEPEGEAYGNKIAKVIWEIRKAKSLAWRDSLVEQLIELIEPSPGAATIQEPVTVAEPVGAVLDENSGIATLLQSYKESRNTAEHTLLMIETLLSAAPMVADPAGVAVPIGYANLETVDFAIGFFENKIPPGYLPVYLAATVKAVPKIRITLRQARRLVDFFGGHDADVTVTERPAVWEQVEEGLYVFCTEYPEDGAQFLGATEVDDELMRLGTVKAVPSEALDAARYRFLRKGFGDMGPDVDLHNAFVDGDEKMDAAIDAAIKSAAPLADKTGGGE